MLTLGSEAEKPGEQAIAVSYIADRFERDWQEISNKFKEEEDSKEILGGFMVRAELPAADGLVKLKGASSTFHDSGVYAEVELTRIDNAIS